MCSDVTFLIDDGSDVFDLPVDGRFADLFEHGIGFGEMAASKEAVVRGQGAGMRCFQDEMPGVGDQLDLVSGITAP